MIDYLKNCGTSKLNNQDYAANYKELNDIFWKFGLGIMMLPNLVEDLEGQI